MRDVTIQNYNHIFWNFIACYDAQNSNILRKIIHSFSVAEKCFAIACQLKLDKKQRELAYLVGLFHDIGRFEQWKLYQTFNDKISVDHGDLGEQMLAKNREMFDLSERQFQVFVLAIKYHTKQYVGSDEDIILYNTIVKNADAYSNVITTANGAQPMTTNDDGYTKQILHDFLQLKPLWIYSPKTKLDRALMLTACTYYVKYDFLRSEILQKNYIDAIFETFSKYLNEFDKSVYQNAISVLKKKYIELNPEKECHHFIDKI